MKLQLEEAKVAAANAVSKYQSSEEMASLRKTLHDKAYEDTAKAFAYTMATTYSEWDLAFLGKHLINQITEWRTGLQAAQVPVDERPASQASARPPSSSAKPLVIPPPPPKVLPEQVIEGNQEPVARLTESDESIE